MGLFGKKQKDNDREELKGKIENLMNQYDKEEIDGDTYFKKMMNLSSDYQKKKKK